MRKIPFLELLSYLKNKSINIEFDDSNIFYFSGINSLEFADNLEISFFHDNKFIDLAQKTKAKACFVNKNNLNFLTKNCIPILVDNPYQAYALTTNFLFPREKSNKIISTNSIIDDDAILEPDIQIDENVIIRENTKLFDHCIIHANSIIGPNVEIGPNTIIMPNCVIRDSIIGNDCTIQSGVIVGGKGFGFTPDTKIEIMHVGKVMIGNNVDIGSNTTIDKANLNATIIEDNVRIDNLVQIAHNVKVGKNTIIAGQSGIAGSSTIGSNCLIGGQVGISGHLKIGNNVQIAAKSGVRTNIKDNSKIAGDPAVDIIKWKRNFIKNFRKS